jgi:hypothetical protein
MHGSNFAMLVTIKAAIILIVHKSKSNQRSVSWMFLCTGNLKEYSPTFNPSTLNYPKNVQ